MSKEGVRTTAKEVVMPVSVILACIAFVSHLVGVLPELNAKQPSGVEARMAAIEAREAERERQYREDRNEMLRVIYDVQGAVRRIEGKLEK